MIYGRSVNVMLWSLLKMETMLNRELINEIIQGAYDLHIHSAPSAFDRELNDLELVMEADEAGMAGVMIKAHYGSTAPRAALINSISGCNAKAYGGLVLNHPVGGLNSYAVIDALRMGASVIWMPTRDSAHCLSYGLMRGDFFTRPGISVLDENGRLKEEVYDILDIVGEAGAFVATGHLSPGESVILCREGRKRNVNMILTHPEWQRTIIDADTQAELARLGVIIEKNWINIVERSVSIEEMAKNIRAAGPENVFIATDRGQKGFEHPVEAMKLFIGNLLQQGFKSYEIEIMTRKVPERIVKGK